MKLFKDDTFKYSEISNYEGTCLGLLPSVHKSHVKLNDTADGHVISTIDFAAFLNDPVIEAVDFPECIDIVGQRAFEGCRNLKYVFFNGTHNGLVIQNRAFVDCKLLTGVTILRPTMVSYEAFRYCSNLRHVDVHASEIKEHAFANCPMLHTALLTSDSIAIDATAFKNSNKISDIYINGDIKGSVDFIQFLPKNTKIHCKKDSVLTELVYDGVKIITDIS